MKPIVWCVVQNVGVGTILLLPGTNVRDIASHLFKLSITKEASHYTNGASISFKRGSNMKLQSAAVLSLLLVFIITVCSAQPRRMSPDERTAELKKELSLTEKQAVHVKKIFEQLQRESEELFEASGGNRGALREMMMKKNNEADEKISALLTADQKKKFEEFKKQRRARFEERQRQRRD